VPLLDGKYEILSEHPLGDGVVRFDATTADGHPVRVVWYDLSAADEAPFERYRRGLRRLARDGLADVLDVVSRPGARYVAWRAHPEDGADAPLDAATAARLREAGLAPERARLRLGPRGPLVADLPFGADSVPTPQREPPAAATPQRTRRGLALLSDAAASWAIAGALALLALVLVAGGFAVRANDRLVRVPDPGGADAVTVAERLVASGLRVEGVARASDEPSGTVLGLDPEAGTPLRPGRLVRLAYAVSPGQVAPATVPALLGQSLASAEARLNAAGLDLGRVVRVHENAPNDVVLAQSASAGSVLGVGTPIDLLISLGPRQATTFVPDLVGLDEEDARALALVAGLANGALVVERVEASEAAPGTVVSQSLAPYRRVPLDGAVLRLLVAEGRPGIEAAEGLPNLSGLSEADARAFAAGFDVRVQYVEDGMLPDGVVRQSLRPGSQPGEGALTLTVNVRPVPIPVPTVQALVRQPRLREVPYLWLIEPGIPVQTAAVTAVTLDGVRTVVRTVQVRGGERVEGSWLTTYPGPVRFELTLNDEPYGGTQLVP
jgi:beta-lactam-binding protein with PASTA domain